MTTLDSDLSKRPFIHPDTLQPFEEFIESSYGADTDMFLNWVVELGEDRFTDVDLWLIMPWIEKALDLKIKKELTGRQVNQKIFNDYLYALINSPQEVGELILEAMKMKEREEPSLMQQLQKDLQQWLDGASV